MGSEPIKVDVRRAGRIELDAWPTVSFVLDPDQEYVGPSPEIQEAALEMLSISEFSLVRSYVRQILSPESVIDRQNQTVQDSGGGCSESSLARRESNGEPTGR